MNNTEYISRSSDFVELEKVREFVKDKTQSFGLNDDDCSKIALAVDEACTNLIKHAFKIDDNNIFCITVEKKKKKIIVSISDNGAPFDPKNVIKPNMNDYFREYRHGGLGIHLMRSIMDDIKYYPASKDRKHNVLKLIKNVD